MHNFFEAKDTLQGIKLADSQGTENKTH